MLYKEQSGQTSTELILLFAGMIMIILLAMNIYQNYLVSLSDELNNNEVNDLINKIDKINDYVKK
ncbi:class III signal peptide-containing protein [uncultured Methanosphaera sp.]|uniref:class III signal peptide-containing protein n=1 Tax=uncultured Methanosphaera sp. TaxID=262501 RepID=UPI0025DB89E9|nr:class III signal peptide-containing protein [uncultured Methanosphaera sp.]